MDMSRFVPNGDRGWIIRGDTIYYHHYIDIPLLSKRGDLLFIYIDFRIKRKIFLMIRHLVNLGEEFFFLDPSVWGEICVSDLSSIIDTYLGAICDEDFFKFITGLDFDFGKNFGKFMETFDCRSLFNQRFEKVKKKIKPRKNWSTGETYYSIESECIRDYVSNLGREITLRMLLD
jgi:hypothetical protein